MQITINEDEYQELMRVKREYKKIKDKINHEINKYKDRHTAVQGENWENKELRQDYLNEIYCKYTNLEELLK